jgi:type II secretory pathway component PulF
VGYEARHLCRTPGIHLEKRAPLYLHLSAQVSNGKDIIGALEGFKKRMVRNEKTATANIITSIIRRMNDGSSFSSAMEKWVPEDEVMMLEAGDLSGALPLAIDNMMDSKERTQRVRSTVISALISPLIYVIAVYGFLWGIGNFVVPSLAATVPPEKAHGMVSVLYGLGSFATSWWAFTPPVVAIALIVVITLSLPKWRGTPRVMAEKYFPYSFYRDINGYSWLLGFISLLEAGVPEVEILGQQIKKANPWMKERLNSVHKRMRNGEGLAQALGCEKTSFGFPNPDIIDNIESMSGFQDFPQKIKIIARQWADSMERSTSERAKAFGFAVEIIMYGIMGFLMVAINSLSSQVSGSM